MERDINDPDTWAHPPRDDYDSITRYSGGGTTKVFRANISADAQRKICENVILLQYQQLGYI